EQSFISNSEAESKSLVKYFKSKKKMEAEINDTSLTNQESLTNDISNIKNELVIKENETFPIIINKQNPESLIQDITIEGAVCAGEALVNDKNHSYGFPIRYTKEPKKRITTYETLPYGHG
ncbi:15920_t:CDS:2, partial [Gigaspora rosea]